jgi:LmbE family N-acetylglucosaminyl deacetylase
MTERRLLAVFAHPDDEAYRPGGTLALLAGRGVRVHLLTATRGEAGSCGDPHLPGDGQLDEVCDEEEVMAALRSVRDDIARRILELLKKHKSNS